MLKFFAAVFVALFVFFSCFMLFSPPLPKVEPHVYAWAQQDMAARNEVIE